jgi:hypothetical protein
VSFGIQWVCHLIARHPILLYQIRLRGPTYQGGDRVGAPPKQYEQGGWYDSERFIETTLSPPYRNYTACPLVVSYSRAFSGPLPPSSRLFHSPAPLFFKAPAGSNHSLLHPQLRQVSSLPFFYFLYFFAPFPFYYLILVFIFLLIYFISLV